MKISLLVALLLLPNFSRAEEGQVSLTDDTLIPEAANLANASDQEEEVVVVKKPRRRKVVVVDDSADSAQRNSIGNTIDSTINKKLDEAKNRMAEKLADAINKMEINVGEDQAAKDQLATRASAVEKTEIPADLNQSQVEIKEEGLKGRVSIAPIFGLSSINNDNYNMDSRYTVGVGMEVDITDNVSFTASFRYSQYDVSLASSNPTYSFYNANNPSLLNTRQQLEYNQNVIDATGRYYVLPTSYRFRPFLGAGIGYNRGFLNYDQKTLDAYNNNPYYASSGQLDDYSVSSVLGILELGGDLQLSKGFAVGINFKYNSILSSSENQPLNNNAFLINSGNPGPTDKNTVGGSLRDSSFYSLLGTVKISF